MYLCLHLASGLITATEVNAPADCPATDYLASSAAAFVDVQTMSQLFQTYFAFDQAIFENLIGQSLIALIGGVGVGVVISLIRRT